MIIWEIKLAEIITIGLSVIGGGFALYQWIKTSKLKRANYYNEAYLKLREDKDIVDILHMIDYGMKKWYPFESHDDPQIENKVDKTLGFWIIYAIYAIENLSEKENSGISSTESFVSVIILMHWSICIIFITFQKETVQECLSAICWGTWKKKI